MFLTFPWPVITTCFLLLLNMPTPLQLHFPHHSPSYFQGTPEPLQPLLTSPPETAYLIQNPYFKTINGPQSPCRLQLLPSLASGNTTSPWHSEFQSQFLFYSLLLQKHSLCLKALFRPILSFADLTPTHCQELLSPDVSQIPLLQALKNHVPFLSYKSQFILPHS